MDRHHRSRSLAARGPIHGLLAVQAFDSFRICLLEVNVDPASKAVWHRNENGPPTGGPSSVTQAFLEQRLHVRFDVLRCHLRLEAFHDVAGPVDEELGEVPADVGGVGVAQVLVKIACAVPVHFDFREEREIDVVFA